MNYENFCHATKNKNRFFYDEKIMSFLETLLEMSNERQVILEEGYNFWRAQVGDGGCYTNEDDYGQIQEWPDLQPHSKERMKPILHSATEGRANPKGISYLYLATDKETAISEVRPWVGSTISVGQFRIKKELILIECADFLKFSDNKTSNVKTKVLSREETIKLKVWSDIDNAFSEPINSTDRTSEYVPTQIIAEFFKSKGFDGIAYKSSLSNGVNVVLFNLNMADLISCTLFEVTSVKFTFKPTGIPYSCGNYSDPH